MTLALRNEWLNYHHLYYFWTVAREGNISKASRLLRLSQPTVSAQLKALEDRLGEKLFEREGRGVTLTEMGKLVFRYADEIFSLGQELLHTVKHKVELQERDLRVGINDALSKLAAYRIIEPALDDSQGLQVKCSEGSLEHLLARLRAHELDLVVSNARAPSAASTGIFHHPLGDCGVGFFASDQLPGIDPHKPFPESLRGVPFLFPSIESPLRTHLDAWFQQRNLTPKIVGEFDDSALMGAFGQSGRGVFVAPIILENEIERTLKVKLLGRSNELREQFYVISAERKVKHPAVARICTYSKKNLFGPLVAH